MRIVLLVVTLLFVPNLASAQMPEPPVAPAESMSAEEREALLRLIREQRLRRQRRIAQRVRRGGSVEVQQRTESPRQARRRRQQRERALMFVDRTRAQLFEIRDGALTELYIGIGLIIAGVGLGVGALVVGMESQIFGSGGGGGGGGGGSYTVDVFAGSAFGGGGSSRTVVDHDDGLLAASLVMGALGITSILVAAISLIDPARRRLDGVYELLRRGLVVEASPNRAVLGWRTPL